MVSVSKGPPLASKSAWENSAMIFTGPLGPWGASTYMSPVLGGIVEAGKKLASVNSIFKGWVVPGSTVLSNCNSSPTAYPNPLLNTYLAGITSSDNFGFTTVPVINFDNINKVKRDIYYNLDGVTASTLVDATFLPIYQNVNHLTTGSGKKTEYFFNKINLGMRFYGDNSGNSVNYIIDNLHFYEVDMIPFFQYFIETSINKSVQIPYQGIAPFIDYTNSRFTFLDNISVGFDSVSIVSSSLPVSGVGVSIGGGLGNPATGSELFTFDSTCRNLIIGEGHFVDRSRCSVIVGGYYNTLDGDGERLCNASIIGGTLNKICYESNSSSILGGCKNCVELYIQARLEGYSPLIEQLNEGLAPPEHRNCIQKTTQSRRCATIA